jgi:dienelactone hydrolase
MRKFISTASCLLLLFLAPVRAQQQQPMTGTFQTYIGDRLVATESYRATFKPDGSIATEGEITPTAAGSPKQKVTTLASKTKPDSFVFEVGGVKALEAKFADGGVVKLNAAGQPEREVKTRATLVMENLVWHQFVFLLNQYDEARGGRQNFTAFLPSQGVEYPLTVEAAPAQSYTLKDRTRIATRRYKVVAAGALALDVWTDEARVPLLFQVESQEIKVVRQGFENLAEVAFAVPAEYKSPAYVAPAAFDARELTVGASGAWPLPATLTMPKGKAPFPAIVLVHGSGPNDRDETLGANKPFRDLAEGLASQGIAVLRYEKRTKQHGARSVASSSNFTVKDETIDDALAAVALLRQTQGIDAKKIFVLGHSLGGMLVPRIGTADKGIAGFVVFAGATRPLEDTLVRQYEYVAALDGTVSEAERAQIDEAKRQAALVKEFNASTDSKLRVYGAPPAYWLDLRGYNPPQAARALKRPMLILQGERDYNVTLDDFRNWRTALADSKEVEFKSYPKLDHLFYEGEGAASGADYAQPRNIPRYVIEDIAAWLKRH